MRPAPGLPRSIGGEGMAALISVSQPLQTIRRSNMPHDAERGRDVIQNLTDHRSRFQEVVAAAGWAGTILNLMDLFMARQMIRHRLAHGPVLQGFVFGWQRGRRLDGGSFDILKSQFELLDRPLDLFRRGAETRPAQGRKLRLQLFDQRVARVKPAGLVGEFDRLRGDDRTQGFDIFRQVGDGLAHGRILADLPLSKKRFCLESLDFQAVRDGGDDQEGRRQSMPSHSIASCAAVNRAAPSAAEGQGKRPRSRTL